MKTISTLFLGAFLIASAAAAAETTKVACHCEDCKCTPDSDCGCCSAKGCRCGSADGKCNCGKKGNCPKQ